MATDADSKIDIVLGQMAEWIRASCDDYSLASNEWFCKECGLTGPKENVSHESECGVRILLDLAKAAIGDDEARGQEVVEEECSHGAPVDECAYLHDGTVNPYHHAPDSGPCRGYWGPQYSGSQGEQTRMKQGCPELARRHGTRGQSHGDDWKKVCPNCGNTGTAPWDTPTKEPAFINDGLAR